MTVPDYEKISILLRNDDIKGLEILYKAVYSDLLRFAISLCRNNELANDLIHDAFIRLWNNRSNLPDKVHIKPYLFTIVTHLYINHRKHLEIIRKFENKISLNSNTTSINTADLNTENTSQLWAAVNQLPERAKLIFIMFVIDGLKQAEIAQKLDISPKTVEVQVYKAKQFLKEKLKYFRKQ